MKICVVFSQVDIATSLIFVVESLIFIMNPYAWKDRLI